MGWANSEGAEILDIKLISFSKIALKSTYSDVGFKISGGGPPNSRKKGWGGMGKETAEGEEIWTLAML